MSKQAEKYLELTYKDSIMPKKYHAWTFDEVTKEMEAYHQSRVNAIIKEQSHPDTLEESEFQEAYYALYEQLLKQ